MAERAFEVTDSTVGALFRDDYRFVMPSFQRPYSWKKEKAEQLLADLLRAAGGSEPAGSEPADGDRPAGVAEAAGAGGPAGAAEAAVGEAAAGGGEREEVVNAGGAGETADSEPYFLGTVVIVREGAAPVAKLIDGQQRLVTLTMILCAARDYVSAAFVPSLEGRVFRSGDPILGTAFEPRVSLRDRDQEFFRVNVQERAGTVAVRRLGRDTLSVSQARLAENMVAILDRLATVPRAECERLIQYIDRSVHVALVVATSENAAIRIFDTLNDRGQNLTIADILKVDVIELLAPGEQELALHIWEEVERDLGGRLDLFLSQVRTVHTNGNNQGTILDDFRRVVLPRYGSGRAFIDKCLVPYAEAFDVVTRARYGDGDPADEVNILLRWLKATTKGDEWVPVVMAYLLRPATTRADLTRFLRDLERLAASMLVRDYFADRREGRYTAILRLIRADRDLVPQLQLQPNEIKATRDMLDGDLSKNYNARKYVLRRLDAALAAGSTLYALDDITIEHVLPDRPLPDSEWMTWFPSAPERRYWTERLANLVLLTARKNRDAGRMSFADKKKNYFVSRHGVTPFALTTSVLQEESWTPEVLKRRQTQLVGLLTTLWRLRG